MTADIEIERSGTALCIALRRSKALNALTLPMIRALHSALLHARDAAVDRVIIRGDARAFCAGGDMRAVREAILAGDRDGLSRSFFLEEYRLNHAIASFDKPWIALIDGIAMGGGLGISVHGSHRVVTEKSVLAMPEMAIGMIPDVGATCFLSRLPGEIGTWLALTGARLHGDDAVALGLATHLVNSDRLDALATALAVEPIEPTLAHYAEPVHPKIDRATIDRLFAGDDIDAIRARVDEDDSELARVARASLTAASPTSLAIALRLLRSRGTSLADCLAAEYRAVRAVTWSHDFAEAVRAVLVDKTRDAKFGAVDEAVIARAFAPPPEGDWTP
jgi:enoyl-CoA hydratase